MADAGLRPRPADPVNILTSPLPTPLIAVPGAKCVHGGGMEMTRDPAPSTPLVQLGSAVGRRAKVLLVEDDALAVELIEAVLERAGHRVFVARSATYARRLLANEGLDLVLLDLGLPDASGLALCAEIVRSHRIPVIIVSGAGTPDERIAGFDAGADDYIPKPAHPVEMLRRVEAVLRRCGFEAASTVLTTPQGLALDLRAGVATLGGQRVVLTRSETNLLRLLIEHQGTAVSSEELTRRVWNYESTGETNFLHKHMSRLRGKLRSIGFDTAALRTVYGVGYSLLGGSSEGSADDSADDCHLGG